MHIIAIRFLGCLTALSLSALLFPGSSSLFGALMGSLMLTLLYIIIRPLLLTLALPFNLLLFGLVTPLADGLLVRWTAAWINGLTLNYWQGVVLALVISLAYYPYSRYIIYVQNYK
ncbi:MAG: phage holin family protein [Clostridiales bacterium]|nr:phage holin family protein [Clostridiales bacterium]